MVKYGIFIHASYTVFIIDIELTLDSVWGYALPSHIVILIPLVFSLRGITLLVTLSTPKLRSENIIWDVLYYFSNLFCRSFVFFYFRLVESKDVMVGYFTGIFALNGHGDASFLMTNNLHISHRLWILYCYWIFRTHRLLYTFRHKIANLFSISDL